MSLIAVEYAAAHFRGEPFHVSAATQCHKVDNDDSAKDQQMGTYIDEKPAVKLNFIAPRCRR